MQIIKYLNTTKYVHFKIIKIFTKSSYDIINNNNVKRKLLLPFSSIVKLFMKYVFESKFI